MAPRVWSDMESMGEPPRQRSCVSVTALSIVAVSDLTVPEAGQAAVIAGELGMQPHFHPVLRVVEEQYGDAILTTSSSTLIKAGLLPSPNAPRREPRGAIRVATEIAGMTLDIINTHLGLTRAERSMQVGALLGPDWIGERGHERALILTFAGG